MAHTQHATSHHIGIDLNRLALIGIAVTLSHTLVLWQVQLSNERVTTTIQPMVMLVTPATPPSKPLDTPLTKPVKAPATKAAQPVLNPKAAPPPTETLPRSAEVPLPNSTAPHLLETAASRPTGDVAPATATGSTSPAQKPEPGTASVRPSAGTAATAIQLPSSNADYLNNPAPVYPAISQRLGEQGQVVVRVLIGKDGNAHRGEVFQSSGYERLDQAALRAVVSWRFVPGQRSGMPQDMWFNVPVSFTLK